jgi:predicted nucleotidyltransferase
MLNQDYKDILLCLKKQNVKFILVGAYAMAAHGYPRATGDIDIWVKADDENAKLVKRALVEFGAPVLNVSENDLAYSGNVLQIGVAPCRVDILTAIDGVEFDDAWLNKKNVEVDGINIYVISLDDLIKNKSATGREKDKVDVSELNKIRG